MTTTGNRRYKVLIPTAGTGSRLEDLTKYLNKSLVSIENKPILARIIEMFPENAEFVIALGYKGELVKQFLTLAYPDRTFFYATVEKYEGEGSGLGLTVLSCEKYLQEPFIFCSCDTIVTDDIPYPDKNIAGWGNGINDNQYRKLSVSNDKVIKIADKGEKADNLKPYIGLALIKNWRDFWKYMHNGDEKEIIRLGETYPLIKFAEENELYAKKFNWFDTGNKEALKKAQEYFKDKNSPNILIKPNEAIWFISDKVIKYSDDKNFISDRVKRSNYLNGYIPKIENYTENMYLYKKVKGTVLSKIKDIDIFKKLLEYSKEFWKKETLNEEERTAFLAECRKFYKDKTLKRMDLYYKTFNQKDEKTIINGKEIPKLSDLIKLINEKIYEGLPGRFHGDFHFENILYNDSDNSFCFLDWRQNFGTFLTMGDIYYDLAKLLHGLIICHELIVKNKYSVEQTENIINFSFERKEILIECENYFYKWLEENNYDVKKVKILCALIYLNIAALHHYPYCHLLYYLGKLMLFEYI